jgi:hypothetical protein
MLISKTNLMSLISPTSLQPPTNKNTSNSASNAHFQKKINSNRNQDSDSKQPVRMTGNFVVNKGPISFAAALDDYT